MEGVHFNSGRGVVEGRISGAKTRIFKSTTMYTLRSREGAGYLAIWWDGGGEWGAGAEYSRQQCQPVQRP